MHGRQNRLRNSSATEKDLRIATEDSAQSESWKMARGYAAISRHNGGRAMSEQNFQNHGKFVSSYHFFAVPVFLINFLWSLYRLWKLWISFEGVFGVILAAALVVLAFRTRVFALAVEDPRNPLEAH